MSGKIIHVITQMEAAGAQGAAVRNAKAMRAAGVDSHTVFLYVKRPAYLGEPGVVALLDHKPRGVADLLRILVRLFRHFRRNRDAAVIAYTHYANVICGIVGRLAGVRRVVASHRNPANTYPGWCRKVDLALGTLGAYSSAIAVSETVYESFRDHPARYRKRLVVVRNGIEIGGYAPDKERTEDHADSHERPIRFVTAGRLHHQKNQSVIVRAIKSLDNASLVIAGEGDLRADLENLIRSEGLESKVSLIGEIKPSEVRELLATADVFLFPSKYEAFGFSVVEAMAAGCPVICSDIPAMREVVADAGLLVPPFDVPAWVEAMQRVAMDTSLRKEMRRRSIERARLFSLGTMVEGYMRAARTAPASSPVSVSP